MYDLRRVFPDSEFVYVDFYDKERLAEEVKDADVAIVMGDVDPCLLGENTLKWIQCDHAGLNGSARPEVFARGIPVTGAAGRSAPVLAEHAVYFMFQGCYHTKELLAAQEKCQWGVVGSESWRGLYGRTAGIIGMGNNGRLLADRLHAMGMKIIAYNRSPIQGLDYIDQKLSGKNGDTIEPLLRQSDFIILTIALTDETFQSFPVPGWMYLKNSLSHRIPPSGICQLSISHRIARRRCRIVRQLPLPSSGKMRGVLKRVNPS